MTTDNRSATRCGAMECAGQSGAVSDCVFDADRARFACLCCGQRVDFARTVTARSTGAPIVAGVCRSCIEAGSQEHVQATLEMAMAASRLADYLALIRRGAARQLAGWWGGIGACTQDELDGATIALRRALERNGWRR